MKEYDDRPSKPITVGCEVYPRHNIHSVWTVEHIQDGFVSIRGGKGGATIEIHSMGAMNEYWRVKGACK